jgi:hypothetical protein
MNHEWADCILITLHGTCIPASEFDRAFMHQAAHLSIPVAHRLPSLTNKCKTEQRFFLFVSHLCSQMYTLHYDDKKM